MALRRALRVLLWAATGGLAFLLIGTLLPIQAASNTVPDSAVGASAEAVTANDLKPAACVGLNLTAVVSGGVGTAGNDLLLGTAGADTLDGAGGADCILGGGGDDTLIGGAGDDVLVGGAGNDICTATAGADIYASSCEVQN